MKGKLVLYNQTILFVDTFKTFTQMTFTSAINSPPKVTVSSLPVFIALTNRGVFVCTQALAFSFLIETLYFIWSFFFFHVSFKEHLQKGLLPSRKKETCKVSVQYNTRGTMADISTRYTGTLGNGQF